MQFSLQKLAFNCCKFQKITIYNDEWQINDNFICWILRNIKRTVPLFSYFEGQMHLYLSFYSYFHATVLLKQYSILIYAHLFKNIKLLIFLNFNFSHTIFSSLAHNATLTTKKYIIIYPYCDIICIEKGNC